MVVRGSDLPRDGSSPPRPARRACRLTDPHRLLVHVDAKYDATPFRDAAPRAGFLPDRDRVDVQWGRWSNVVAITRLMRAARILPDEYATLISGDSSPVREVDAIERFLRHHAGCQFIDTIPARDDPEAMRRIQSVHLERHPGSGLRMRLANRGRRALDHRDLGGRDPRWGSVWWTLNGQAIRWTLDTLARDARLRHLYRYSHIPDEGLMPTMLASSPFADQLRPSLMYAEIPHGMPHARALDDHDWTAEEMTRSWGTGSLTITGPALWARKFTTPEAMRAAVSGP